MPERQTHRSFYAILTGEKKTLNHLHKYADKIKNEIKQEEKAVRVKSADRRERVGMLVLGIIVLLLGGYLVYALVHPEKF